MTSITKLGASPHLRRQEAPPRQSQASQSDPFLRKALEHFRLPLPPSIGETAAGAGSVRKAAHFETMARALLAPAEPDRTRFVPRNHLASLAAIHAKAERAAGETPKDALLQQIGRMIGRDMALARSFQGERLLAMPC